MRMVRVEVAIKKRESHANVVYGITARKRAVSIYLTIVILRFLNVNYLACKVFLNESHDYLTSCIDFNLAWSIDQSI